MVKPSQIIQYIVLLACISLRQQAVGQSFTLSGYVKEQDSEEPLIGAIVYDVLSLKGTVTNEFGFYSLTLPEGKYQVKYSFIGFKPEVHKIDLMGKNRVDMILKPDVELLNEVVVTDRGERTESRLPEMSKVSVPVEHITQMPAFLGERDVLKTLQFLPGVQSGMEGSSGLYVRGGGVDQNLILLDGAPVYNAFYLMGFFSLFNGDAIKNVELTKGGFPARYGGTIIIGREYGIEGWS